MQDGHIGLLQVTHTNTNNTLFPRKKICVRLKIVREANEHGELEKVCESQEATDIPGDATGKPSWTVFY